MPVKSVPRMRALALSLCLAACTSTSTAPAPPSAPSLPPAGHSGSRCPRAASTAAAAPAIVWRHDPFASEFWALDQLSQWDEQGTSPGYVEHFQTSGALDALDREALAGYARVRRAPEARWAAFSRGSDRAGSGSTSRSWGGIATASVRR